MNYIIGENGSRQYWFCRQNEGICFRHLRGDGEMGERRCVLGGSFGAFGIWQDGERVHIVAASADGEMIYAKYESGEAERIILTGIPDGTEIAKLSLYPVRGRLNMLFSVRRGGEIFLMHCILGNNALPHTVSKLLCADFFVDGMRVYYTRPDGAAGFSELADERPEIFVRTANGASPPYVIDGHIVYASGGKIYFDNREIFAEEGAQNPIAVEVGSEYFILWQNGTTVRYISAHGGEIKPNGIINPSCEPRIFEFISPLCRRYFYGACPGERLVFYVKNDPFETPALTPEQTLKRRMTEMKREIEQLRAELAMYGK